MVKCIIFDIDGTLADCRHRQHHVQNGRSNWKAFYEGIPQDGVNDEIHEILALFSAETNYRIFICTGRSEDYMEITKVWLRKNLIFYDELYMRPSGDFRPDHIIKSQMLDKILEEGYEPLFVVDDHPDVVKMWRERGLMCLQCNNIWGDDIDATVCRH